ncbi:MAG: CvpA family protein [Rikenellaceae bacterium]
MNLLDIIILVILAYALYEGVREGLIIQGLSLVGIAIGVWFGAQYGSEVVSLFGISGEYSAVWGFIITLIITMVLVAIAARLIRGVLKFAGFAFLDNILGALLSICKYLLILSMLFSAFDIVNNAFTIVDDKEFEKSKMYRPIANISHWATPAWSWTQQQFETTKKEWEKSNSQE